MWRSLHPRKVWYVIFPFYQGVVLIQIYCLVCLFISDAKIGAARRLQCGILQTKRFFSSCFYLREIYFLEKNCHSKIEVLVNCFVLRWCLVVLVNIYIAAMCHALVYTFLFSLFWHLWSRFPPLMLVVSSCLARPTSNWLGGIGLVCVRSVNWRLSTVKFDGNERKSNADVTDRSSIVIGFSGFVFCE